MPFRFTGLILPILLHGTHVLLLELGVVHGDVLLGHAEFLLVKRICLEQRVEFLVAAFEDVDLREAQTGVFVQIAITVASKLRHLGASDGRIFAVEDQNCMPRELRDFIENDLLREALGFYVDGALNMAPIVFVGKSAVDYKVTVVELRVRAVYHIFQLRVKGIHCFMRES
jgi:hypothetical protein